MISKSIRELLRGRSIVGIAPGASLNGACEMMGLNNVDALVVFRGGDLCGIISERDIIRHVSQYGGLNSTKVAKVMTDDVQVASTRDSVSQTYARMRLHGFQYLPVLDLGNAVIDMLSLDDIPAEYRTASQTDMVARRTITAAA